MDIRAIKLRVAAPSRSAVFSAGVELLPERTGRPRLMLLEFMKLSLFQNMVEHIGFEPMNRKLLNAVYVFLNLVEHEGFEPSTSSMPWMRASQLRQCPECSLFNSSSSSQLS